MKKYTDTEVSEVAVERLVKMSADGNEQAFAQLVSIYEDSVFNMAMYITQNREDALDVSQEVFLKLWRTLDSFRWECSLKSYLMKLTKNAALDLKRRASCRQTVSLTVENDDGEESQMDLPDPSEDANPEMAYLRREKIEKVRRAIAKLDEDHRQVIVMREINGMSYREISDTLGINEGTVKSRINRARESLKKILTEGNIF